MITLLGYQTNPYKYVSKCDLFVCASFAEGFSTAATEALIVGTPVCTVEVSGMKEMLGEHNEWGVVTENSEEALYQGIKDLLDHPDKLAYYKEKPLSVGRASARRIPSMRWKKCCWEDNNLEAKESIKRILSENNPIAIKRRSEMRRALTNSAPSFYAPTA